MRLTITLALGVAMLAVPALAQTSARPPAVQQGSSMQGMDHSNMPGMDHSKMQGMNHGAMGAPMSREMAMMHGGPAGPEYHANMQRMHQTMMQQSMDTDPTRSWAKSMIAHHQGAIDNSRTVLKHTQNAEARRLAAKTIRENERGQAELRALLARLNGAAR